jgi:hypothetical protein
MNLSPAQLVALKTDILADATFNGVPHTADGAATVAAAYNLEPAPTFWVYRSSIPVKEVFDQILWANLTPAQPVPDSAATSGAALAWQSRALMCQAKQFNLQTMLQGRDTIDGTKANVRAGLQDALTNVPSASDGVGTLSGGWVGVRDNVLPRHATRAEKLFATGGTGADTQHVATMLAEGQITGQNVAEAMGW